MPTYSLITLFAFSAVVIYLLYCEVIAKGSREKAEVPKSDKDREFEEIRVERRKFARRLSLALVAVVLIWLCMLLFSEDIFRFLRQDIEPHSLGQFGDMFNVLNSLFTGLAFGAVAITLFLERRDFELSLKEFRRTAQSNRELAEAAMRSRDDRIAELYRIYTSGDVKRARDDFWVVASELWFTDGKFRDYLCYYSQLANRDSWEASLNHCNLKVSERLNLEASKIPRYFLSEMCDSIINFYTYLYNVFETEDDDSEEFKKASEEKFQFAVQDFYYDWWRGFLVSYALCSKKAYDDAVKGDCREQLEIDPRLDLILKLDVRAKGNIKFNPHSHPFFKDLVKSIHEQMHDLYPDGDERVEFSRGESG